MLSDQPECRGEYWWRRKEPIPVAMLALLNLPSRLSVAISYGADDRRQTLSMVLDRSETGFDHLALQGPRHRGNATAATEDIFVLLMNTLITVLQRHCTPQLSLGGSVFTKLACDKDDVDLPWQRFGFQLLGEGGRRRILARVRNLRVISTNSAGPWPPQQVFWNEVQWR